MLDQSKYHLIVAVLFTAITTVSVVVVSGQQCALPVDGILPSNGSVFRALSSQVLHLYVGLPFQCGGVINTWRFISRETTINGLHLSVWRPTSSTSYEMVADTRVDQLVVSQDQWSLFWPGLSGQTRPLVQPGDVMGIFHDQDSENVIPYADKLTQSAGDAQLIKNHYYKTLVWVSFDSTQLILGTTSVSTTNSAPAYRLPALQAVVTIIVPSTTPAAVVPTLPWMQFTTTKSSWMTWTVATTPSTSTTTLSDYAGPASRRCTGRLILNVDYGNCPGAKTTRYYLNSISWTCQSFTGCVTIASFSTQSNCQSICFGNNPDFPTNSSNPLNPISNVNYACSVHTVYGVDFGPCTGVKSLRYYFDSSTRTCSSFQGCVNTAAVANNFDSMEACTLACIGNYQQVTTNQPSPSPRITNQPSTATNPPWPTWRTFPTQAIQTTQTAQTQPPYSPPPYFPPYPASPCRGTTTPSPSPCVPSPPPYPWQQSQTTTPPPQSYMIPAIFLPIILNAPSSAIITAPPPWPPSPNSHP